MPAERPGGETWSRAQRRLHGWSAGLVLAAFAVAWLMVAVPLRRLLVKFLLFQLHKTLGILVLLTVLARLALRVRRGRPRRDACLPAWQARAAAWGQAGLYGLLLVTPVLGYLTASLAPLRVPTLFLGVIPLPALTGPDAAWFARVIVLHRLCAWALVLLAAGHAAMAVHHHRRGTGVLARMWKG